MKAVLRIAEHQGDLCPAALGQPQRAAQPAAPVEGGLKVAVASDAHQQVGMGVRLPLFGPQQRCLFLPVFYVLEAPERLPGGVANEGNSDCRKGDDARENNNSADYDGSDHHCVCTGTFGFTHEKPPYFIQLVFRPHGIALQDVDIGATVVFLFSSCCHHTTDLDKDQC
jgi:hypothetical protein